MRDPEERISQRPTLSEDLDQQSGKALPDAIQAPVGRPQPPEPQAQVDPPGEQANRDNGEEIDERTPGDIPVDLSRGRDRQAEPSSVARRSSAAPARESTCARNTSGSARPAMTPFMYRDSTPSTIAAKRQYWNAR